MTSFKENGQWNEQARTRFLREALRLTIKDQARLYGLSEATVTTYRAQFRRKAGVPSLAPKSNFSHRGNEPETVYRVRVSPEPEPPAGLAIRDLVQRLTRAETERDVAKTRAEAAERKLATIRAAVEREV
jgi:hypothetical protein